MYYDDLIRDEREIEDDEDRIETTRGDFDDDREVYAGHYVDDGNSQRTLSQLKAVLRNREKRQKSFRMYQEAPATTEEEPSGQGEPYGDILNDEDATNQQPQDSAIPSSSSTGTQQTTEPTTATGAEDESSLSILLSIHYAYSIFIFDVLFLFHFDPHEMTSS